MSVGTEHEYSINDPEWKAIPISDRLIKQIAGRITNEVPFGDLLLSKELQKHVLELIPPKPFERLADLEAAMQDGVRRLHRSFGEYRFLGLGMHPFLMLDKTAFWDHDEGEYYHAYDRLFNIKQHGWLNIQALHINFPYGDRENLVRLFNRVRALIPYMIAVSAASPIVEGKATGIADNRLSYYRINQRQIPLICGDILPERLTSVQDYIEINRRIYAELKRQDATVLCHEWVNSRGAIVRFTRGCIEVKAIDEQECIRSDMGVTAFLMALLRSTLVLDEDEGNLRDIMETAIGYGTERLKPELECLYRAALQSATADEMLYLPLVGRRIEDGSLAEIMMERLQSDGDTMLILDELAGSLRNNRPVED